MPLVDYDSSEDEQETREVMKKTTAVPPAQRPTEKKKIIVSLPAAVPSASTSEPQVPSKRSAGTSGLSSLLPPPKRPSRVNPINTTRPVETTTKTGHTSAEKPQETVNPSAPSTPLFNPRPVVRPAATTATKKAAQPLFTIHAHDRPPTEEAATSTDYTPFLHRPPPVTETEEKEEVQETAPVYSNEDYKYDASIDYAGLANFQPVVEEEREKETDRRGRPPAPDEADMIEYDVSREYAQNARLGSSEAAAATAAPVRFVGSGKHQLSSLLNLAQSQRDSFEESFAAQKRAIRDGKARYGR